MIKEGWITATIRKNDLGYYRAKYKKFILDKQCLKRQLKPDDVASLVDHLSSDVSSGCTKQNFIIDAGIT